MGRRRYYYTENVGCKEIFYRWLSAGLWLLVITMALLGFAINEWVGYVFIGIVVITHIIVAIVTHEQKKAEAKKSTSELVREVLYQEDIENAKRKSLNITREYYAQVAKAAEDLYSTYIKVQKLPTIYTLVKSMGVSFKMNGSPVISTEDKVRLLFWTDITRCYVGLGHPIDLDSKEGFGVLYLIALTKGCSMNKPYSSLTTMKGAYQTDAESVLKGTKSYVDSAPEISEVFMLSRLLASSDTELQREFLVNIYRFASITAKADNTITDEEAEWLSNIMKLQSNGNQYIVPMEDVEDDKDVIKGTQENPSLSTKTPKKKASSMSALKELNSLIGLENVKSEVATLSNFIKIQQTREAKGLKTSAVSYHCVFTGNPGTGKTTVARILAKIYKNLGVVSKGHLVETDRAGLVAEYVGQTAVKTNKVIDSALDGVLFIDEAYSLIGGGESDYGKEAIATLLKRMEDNRDRLIVILAGYTKNMKDFIDSNPGLQSRFNRYIEFPDYSAEELLQIFEASMRKYDYHFGEGTKESLMQHLTDLVAHKDANFGNGRLVRNIFEKTLERQANRLAHEVNLTTEKLSQIEVEDLPIK